MARQMLTQKYVEEIKERQEKKQKQEEGLQNVKFMSHSKFLQIVEPSNKYQKIKKQTAIKLTLDKINVLKVVQSLIDFNRKLLKQQNIEEQVDDYIFMNISLQNASDFPNETPIQIKLPNPIYHIDNQNKTEALLIVKEKPEIYTQMCADLDFPSIVHIKTVTEIKKECADGKANVVKKFLNKFDLMLMDDRLAMTSIAKVLGGSDTLIKKRHFPMPVKIHGLDHQHFKKNIQEAFNSVGLLLTPSIEFIFKCGKTESMSNKEIVKNVINCAHKAVCLIMYSQRKIKHNKVKVISLQTTQSLALPIYEIGQDDANNANNE
eukprot:403352471